MKGGDRESIVLPAKELNVKHRGLTLASVVGQAHCCSVVIVNTKNIVQELTFASSNLCAHTVNVRVLETAAWSQPASF